jgi:hypothetical protein
VLVIVISPNTDSNFFGPSTRTLLGMTSIAAFVIISVVILVRSSTKSHRRSN